MGEVLMQSSPRFAESLPDHPEPFTTPFDLSRVLPSRPTQTPPPQVPLSAISVGENSPPTPKRTPWMVNHAEILVSKRFTNLMSSTAKNTPETFMDVEPPGWNTTTPSQGNQSGNAPTTDLTTLHSETQQPPFSSHESDMSFEYSPTTFTRQALPPRHPLPHQLAPIAFNLSAPAPSLAAQDGDVFGPTPTVPPEINPATTLTVPVGKENIIFRRLCETLDDAFSKWDSTISPHDRDNNPDSNVINLQVPYVHEQLIFGQRIEENKFWEGEINLWPGHTRVVKLRTDIDEPCFYGVRIGLIADFWGCDDGVHIFYAMDKKLYAHPGASWGECEGVWEVFFVEGGWDPRGFSANEKLNDFEFREECLE